MRRAGPRAEAANALFCSRLGHLDRVPLTVRCSSLRSLVLVIASIVTMATTSAQAATLRFAPLCGEKMAGCSFEIEGDWTLSPNVQNMYNLDADKGMSPFQIVVLFGLDAKSGMSRDSHKHAEKQLRSTERGNGKKPGATYAIVTLRDDVYGRAELYPRNFTLWITEGANSLTIHYTDGQADKPDIAPAVLSQVCKTFSWKRQHRR